MKKATVLLIVFLSVVVILALMEVKIQKLNVKVVKADMLINTLTTNFNSCNISLTNQNTAIKEEKINSSLLSAEVSKTKKYYENYSYTNLTCEEALNKINSLVTQ